MELIEKWEKRYSDLNEEYLRTKGMMTEREINECLLHLRSISGFIEDLKALGQSGVVDSDDLISRESLIEQISQTNQYYKKEGRFDYSAGLEKARYLVARHGREDVL
jgi:hypothetical protein